MCIVCGCAYDSGGFYQLPKNLETRAKWLSACNITEAYLMQHPERKSWICFRHFSPHHFTTKGKRLKLRTGKCFSLLLQGVPYHCKFLVPDNTQKILTEI
jgi:hypothetical protein